MTVLINCMLIISSDATSAVSPGWTVAMVSPTGRNLLYNQVRRLEYPLQMLNIILGMRLEEYY